MFFKVTKYIYLIKITFFFKKKLSIQKCNPKASTTPQSEHFKTYTNITFTLLFSTGLSGEAKCPESCPMTNPDNRR